jgi:tetratricopeptide (TPR) repeat protein
MESEDYGDHSARGGLVNKKRQTAIVRGLNFSGVRHLKKGRYDQALADYDRAIEHGAANAPAIAGRGMTYAAMERYDEALADLDRAVELDAADTSLIVARGQAYQEMGR